MEAVNPQEQVTEKPAMEPAWAAFATGAESRWGKKVLQGQGLVSLCSRHNPKLNDHFMNVKHQNKIGSLTLVL